VYENGKMRPDETIPGMEGGLKENDGGSEYIYKVSLFLGLKWQSLPQLFHIPPLTVFSLPSQMVECIVDH
jgi:hypothetical protein